MTLTIPDLGKELAGRLEAAAKSHGHTVEAEARAILARTLPLAPREVPADMPSQDFDQFVGIWKSGMSTDEIMELTRGDAIDDAYSRR